MRKILVAAALSAAALSLAPSPAHALAVRAGLETPLYTHVNDVGSSSFTDSLQPAVNLMVSANLLPAVTLDAEGRIGFASTGSGYQRTGTFIGPGITFSPPLFPLYVRASLPIHLEGGGNDNVYVTLRGAVGLLFAVPVVGIYLEGAVDTPLAGNNVDAFKTQQVSLGAGVRLGF